MKIKVRDLDEVVVFDVSGRVMGGPDADLFHDQVKKTLSGGKKNILVNLAKVNWINSTGLGILIAAYTSINDAGGHFKLANISDRIESILMVTKLSGIFEAYETEEEALASFSGK
jgi:anti-sigma B factor antagonist